MTAMEAIVEKLMPEDCWQMQEDILSVLQKELGKLPNSKEVSDQQCRYPETPSALRAFIEKFFARHFFQVQDSLLKEDAFNRLADIFTNSSSITILDIGAGPAVASLALLNMIIQSEAMSKNKTIRIIMNDTSRVCLESGQRMLDSFMRRNRNSGMKISVQSLDIPFPENLSAVKRKIARWGKIDFFFFLMF